jgi:uncharacterized protein YjiS (DUF1127 family)
MNARVAKEEIALLMPTSLASYADTPYADTPYAEQAPAAPSKFARAVRWLIDLPRRRAVLAELSALSDHELADIGLSRTELSRVFDPDFAARRSTTRATLGRSAMA